MYFDWDKITLYEMQTIAEFFDVHIDGDKKTLEIESVKK